MAETAEQRSARLSIASRKRKHFRGGRPRKCECLECPVCRNRARMARLRLGIPTTA